MRENLVHVPVEEVVDQFLEDRIGRGEQRAEHKQHRQRDERPGADGCHILRMTADFDLIPLDVVEDQQQRADGAEHARQRRACDVLRQRRHTHAALHHPIGDQRKADQDRQQVGGVEQDRIAQREHRREHQRGPDQPATSAGQLEVVPLRHGDEAEAQRGHPQQQVDAPRHGAQQQIAHHAEDQRREQQRKSQFSWT